MLQTSSKNKTAVSAVAKSYEKTRCDSKTSLADTRLKKCPVRQGAEETRVCTTVLSLSSTKEVCLGGVSCLEESMEGDS
jgi:hypothetical protein